MASASKASATPLVRAFSRELARAGGLLSPDYLASGMSLGEARCLYELGHSDGFDLSALAAQLDLDLGYVSRAVSRLVQRGLVNKRVGAADGRSRSIVITAKGRTQLGAIDRRANHRLDAWLASKPGAVVDGLRGQPAGVLRRRQRPDLDPRAAARRDRPHHRPSRRDLRRRIRISAGVRELRGERVRRLHGHVLAAARPDLRRRARPQVCRIDRGQGAARRDGAAPVPAGRALGPRPRPREPLGPARARPCARLRRSTDRARDRERSRRRAIAVRGARVSQGAQHERRALASARRRERALGIDLAP